jgi:hypothetical protein
MLLFISIIVVIVVVVVKENDTKKTAFRMISISSLVSRLLLQDLI